MNIFEKPICILGASGFLGSAITQELENLGAPWVGTSTTISHEKIALTPKNDIDSLVSVLSDCDIVVNAAGSLKPKDFERSPSAALNEYWETQEFLSEAFKQSNIKSIVHISSAGTVYGEGDLQNPHLENNCTAPISWYGRAKVCEELWYADLCKRLNIKHLCARVSNPFGNRKKTTHGFIDVALHNAINNKPISIYRDCDPSRDFVFANDMARMIIALIERSAEGYFNVASGDRLHLSTIVEYIEKISKKKITTRISGDRPSYDIANSHVSVEKISNFGAYQKTIEVFEYIEKYLQQVTTKNATEKCTFA